MLTLIAAEKEQAGKEKGKGKAKNDELGRRERPGTAASERVQHTRTRPGSASKSSKKKASLKATETSLCDSASAAQRIDSTASKRHTGNSPSSADLTSSSSSQEHGTNMQRSGDSALDSTAARPSFDLDSGRWDDEGDADDENEEDDCENDVDDNEQNKSRKSNDPFR